ncbi:hypothetical protein Ciccas_008469 [Cichlidogyrus casuarinus]|uniref:Uncharacterized protein n=1 Tax=Cichlidogyrus casuarinus TaxID=1844966 RepID=A0ABD2PZV5_9PLAT
MLVQVIFLGISLVHASDACTFPKAILSPNSDNQEWWTKSFVLPETSHRKSSDFPPVVYTRLRFVNKNQLLYSQPCSISNQIVQRPVVSGLQQMVDNICQYLPAHTEMPNKVARIRVECVETSQTFRGRLLVKFQDQRENSQSPPIFKCLMFESVETANQAQNVLLRITQSGSGFFS